MAAGLSMLGVAMLALSACGGSGSSTVAPTTAPGGTATASPTAGEDTALIKGQTPASYYAAHCATCHGQQREGGIGSPLTPGDLTESDEFYHDVIKNGRAGTGMTMMGTILGMSDEDIATLVTFLKTDQP